MTRSVGQFVTVIQVLILWLQQKAFSGPPVLARMDNPQCICATKSIILLTVGLNPLRKLKSVETAKLLIAHRLIVDQRFAFTKMGASQLPLLDQLVLKSIPLMLIIAVTMVENTVLVYSQMLLTSTTKCTMLWVETTVGHHQPTGELVVLLLILVLRFVLKSLKPI